MNLVQIFKFALIWIYTGNSKANQRSMGRIRCGPAAQCSCGHSLAQLGPGLRSVRLSLARACAAVALLRRQLGGAAERRNGRGHCRGLTGTHTASDHGSTWVKTAVTGEGGSRPGGDDVSFWQRRRTASNRGSDAALGHGGQNGGKVGEASDQGVGAGAWGEVRRGQRRTAATRFGHEMPVGAGF
jgi:hypothetical protein